MLGLGRCDVRQALGAMLGSMGRRRKVKLGKKPHLLVGTALGTLAAFVLFVRHYAQLKEEGGECLHAHSNTCTIRDALSTTYSPTPTYVLRISQARRGFGLAFDRTVGAAATS